MSFTFSIGFRSPMNTEILNEKFSEIWGRNGVLSGFDIAKHSNTQIKIAGDGIGIIRGVRVSYKEDNASNPLKIDIPLGIDGNKYIYGIYNHKLSSFTLHVTDGKYDAIGEWKLFLGHAKVTAGAITEIQGIVGPENVDIEQIYRRMPNMNELINFFYESTDQVGDQIDVILNGKIGDMKKLKTNHKSTIVGSINEVVDTKEPTLTRDRILELLGDGNGGGNINIDYINNIPIADFVLKGRAIRTLDKSGLKGGGDLSVDRNLSIDWGIGENQVPKGNHNHSGYHLDKRYYSNFGTNTDASVYSQLAYFAQDEIVTGAIKITLPKGFTGANLGIDIKGYDNAEDTSSYTLQLGGRTNSQTNAWEMCAANILGLAPFRRVRFGKDVNDNNNACILLGDNGTKWSRSSLFIDQVLASGDDVSRWDSGWKINIIDSDTGIIIDESPTITTGGPQEGNFVSPNRSINAREGIIGGGTLSRDVNIGVDFGTGSNQVSRGNHTHGEYVATTLAGKDKIMITDGTGKVSTTNTVTPKHLSYLESVTSNIQTQLNNKANAHTHPYLQLSGGTMNGALNMGNHKLSTNHFTVGGIRVHVGQSAPSDKKWGDVWIRLPK